MSNLALIALVLVAVPVFAAVDTPAGLSVMKIESAASENPVRKARKDIDRLNKEVEAVDARIAETQVQAQALSSIASARSALLVQSENLQAYRAQLVAERRTAQQQLQDAQ